ncbi:MAG TPA: adenylyl-sulfate kinase [Oligoflexia bacterium]|nr:adenylyl-sulfate kinase [Oligoflexia bacterium]HMP49852.1 adenylyl-sulfate kinase [Oligoflexia bacterium]
MAIDHIKTDLFSPVIWFTGLPCSGKTTLSKALAGYLQERHVKVSPLDGDEIRAFIPQAGFSLEERNTHLRYVGFLARKLSESGIFVTASFVSPTNIQRDIVRNICPNLVLIFVSTPLELCEERDVKGMYKMAREGKIKDFTGVSSPFEIPENPDLEIDTGSRDIESCVLEIAGLLKKRGMLVK